MDGKVQLLRKGDTTILRNAWQSVNRLSHSNNFERPRECQKCPQLEILDDRADALLLSQSEKLIANYNIHQPQTDSLVQDIPSGKPFH